MIQATGFLLIELVIAVSLFMAFSLGILHITGDIAVLQQAIVSNIAVVHTCNHMAEHLVHEEMDNKRLNHTRLPIHQRPFNTHIGPRKILAEMAIWKYE